MSDRLPDWVINVMNKVIRDCDGTDSEDQIYSAFDDVGYLGLLQMLSGGLRTLIKGTMMKFPNNTNTMTLASTGTTTTYPTPRAICSRNEDFDCQINFAIVSAPTDLNIYLYIADTVNLNPFTDSNTNYVRIHLIVAAGITGFAVRDGASSSLYPGTVSGITNIRVSMKSNKLSIWFQGTQVVTEYSLIGGVNQRLNPNSDLFLSITTVSPNTTGSITMNLVDT